MYLKNNSQKKEKKLMIVFHDMTLGGIQRKVIDIINHLQKNETDIKIILCLQKNIGIFLQKLPKNVKVISPGIHTKRYDKTWFTFWMTIQIIKYDPDTILSFMDLGSIPTLMALKLVFWKKPKVVIGEDILTSKYVHIETNPPLRLRLIKHFYPKAESILVQTPIQKHDLSRIINIKNNNIFVSPNWLPLDFPPKTTNKNNNNRPIDVLFIGRIEAQKNLTKFVKIIKIVSRKNPKIKVTIIGSGAELPKIRRIINKLKLQKNIKILPPTINPEHYYLKAKIFLLTSDYEGFPLTLLEAISCGCTPIVNNIPEVHKFFNKFPEQILFDNELEAAKLILAKLSSVDYDINAYYQNKIIKLQQKNITKFVNYLL
jgi:glycosyltransferase involved in cell wall biosynthesis